MTTTLEPTLLDRIRASRSLPSPHAVTARLIELAEDPDVRMDQILDVLRTDPALSARLLRLANSPLYARRRRTDNLRQAITLLGVDAVLTAALSLNMLADHRDANAMPALFNRNRWTRSVHAAICAQVLAERTGRMSPADAFLASLLQDIGVVVLIRLAPEAYRPLPITCTHDDLVVAENERFGCDHAAIGAELLRAWNIPDRIADAVEASHADGLRPEADPLAKLVALGGLIADGLAGSAASLHRAANAAFWLLDVSAATFAEAVDGIIEAIPDLSSILEARAPDPHVMAEMAQDVLVSRLISTQVVTQELNEQLTTMTEVAESLRMESQVDSLTGLANRRRLDETLENEFALASSHEFPLSVLFVDLDDFKLINDRFGHGVGDELLVESARRISACVRDGDIVARYGGEEFVVVLPGAGRESADAAAHRLVERFDGYPFVIGTELSLHQTASIGVATLDDESGYETVGDLVDAADRALYTVKRTGKNNWLRAARECVVRTAVPSH